MHFKCMDNIAWISWKKQGNASKYFCATAVILRNCSPPPVNKGRSTLLQLANVLFDRSEWWIENHFISSTAYLLRTYFFFYLLWKHISLHVNNNIIYQAYIAHVFVPKVLHIFYVHEDTILCTKLSYHS